MTPIVKIIYDSPTKKFSDINPKSDLAYYIASIQ